MMKDVDSSIETILCGSSNSEISTYPQWDYDVLDYVGDLADYISLHKYVGNHNGNTSDFLAVTNSIDEQINIIDSVCKTYKQNIEVIKELIYVLMSGTYGIKSVTLMVEDNLHLI